MTEKSDTDVSFELPAEVACPSCHKSIDMQGVEAFEEATCPHCGRTFKLPVQFGHFILLEQIACGGMGAVFRGHDPNLKRHVAIKVMRRQWGNNEEFVRRVKFHEGIRCVHRPEKRISGKRRAAGRCARDAESLTQLFCRRERSLSGSSPSL